MTERRRADIAFRSLMMAAAFVVLIAGLKAASSILLPVLVAAFLAVLSIPPINWLSSHRVPRWAATLGVFAFVLTGLVLVSLFLGTSIKDFAGNLPQYEDSLQRQTEGLFAWMDDQEWLAAADLDISKESVTEKLDAGRLMALVADAVGAVTAMLSNTLFVLLTVVFILAEAAGFPAKLRVALGTEDRDLGGFGNVMEDLQGYLAIKTVVSLITGVAAGVLCAIVGVDYPVLWALVAFLLNYVPTLGSIIAAFPAVLLALVQFGPGRALAIALGYEAINVTMGNLIEPRLMGKRLGLSTLVVFLSLVFWGYVWGPVGMVLCVPLTMLVKILLANSEELHWISVMLGSGGEARAEARAEAEAEAAQASAGPPTTS